MFESVVRLLTPILDQVVFVGGSTTGLLLTDPGAAGIRPTKDVDTIVNATSYAEYEAVSGRLKALGLVEDTTEGAPLCRWRYKDIVIDVMPIDAKALGFTNRWYRAAVESADTMTVADHTIRIVTPAYFVATKLEAFHGRGAEDITLSHDLEDIVALIDGRTEIVADIANATAGVRAYIVREIRGLMSDADFREAIPGFLLPDSASQLRRALLEERLNAIAALD
jgi:hypothetical protein